MTKSRIHMSVNLFDVVVLCVATLKRSTCIAAYAWCAVLFFFLSALISVYRKKLCLILRPLGESVDHFQHSGPFDQTPTTLRSVFNKSDFKCLAFQTGCRSALYSQTGPHRARPNATPCRAWSHERGPRLGPLESRPTHMRCITSQPENK